MLSSIAKQFDSKRLKKYLLEFCEIIKEDGITRTQPGSLKNLLFGRQPSFQSISIKLGKLGEEMIKKIINEADNLELLTCGVQYIDLKKEKKKDIDLIWIDHSTKTIYFREAKANIELDSEKLPATIDKIIEISNSYIKPTYPDYTINVGIFNWSIYNRNNLKKGLAHIKKCEEKGIKVDHPEDLFKLLNFHWDEEDYYKFFREVGEYFLE